MTPTHQRTSRLPSLTGMRFIAALMVFAFHVAWERFFRDPRRRATTPTS